MFWQMEQLILLFIYLFNYDVVTDVIVTGPDVIKAHINIKLAVPSVTKDMLAGQLKA